MPTIKQWWVKRFLTHSTHTVPSNPPDRVSLYTTRVWNAPTPSVYPITEAPPLDRSGTGLGPDSRNIKKRSKGRFMIYFCCWFVYTDQPLPLTSRCTRHTGSWRSKSQSSAPSCLQWGRAGLCSCWRPRNPHTGLADRCRNRRRRAC